MVTYTADELVDYLTIDKNCLRKVIRIFKELFFKFWRWYYQSVTALQANPLDYIKGFQKPRNITNNIFFHLATKIPCCMAKGVGLKPRGFIILGH